MATLTGLAYWPADTSQPVLEVTTGDLLRQAAGDAGTHAALIEAAPPGMPSLAGAEHTDRRWTYQQLLAGSEQCAHWLLGRFSPGDRITIWAPNIPEWIILQYGAAGRPDHRDRQPGAARGRTALRAPAVPLGGVVSCRRVSRQRHGRDSAGGHNGPAGAASHVLLRGLASHGRRPPRDKLAAGGAAR